MEPNYVKRSMFTSQIARSEQFNWAGPIKYLLSIPSVTMNWRQKKQYYYDDDRLLQF